MPVCANCDEWFEGRKQNQAVCEHCGQVNPLEIIANPDEDPDSWVCRNYFEIKARLLRLKMFMFLPIAGAVAVREQLGQPILGTVLIALAAILAVFVWGLRWSLLVASQDGETQMFRMITCFGLVLSQKERTPDQTGPVTVQLVKSVDRATREEVDHRLICLDRFKVTGFGSRDGGLRFARILADHCGLKVQRLFGG